MAQKDSNPITAGLRRVQRAHKEVDLLNIYKGVPAVFPATLEAISDEGVVISVPTYEAVCLTLEKTTTILHPMLDEAVTANIGKVNLAEQTATLTRLRYASGHIGDRMTVRVAANDPVDVPIECGGQSITARLVDISMNGIGVHVSPKHAALFRARAVVQIALTLPTTTLKLSGTVRFVRPDDEHIRVGLNFAQDTQVLLILHYVRERQVEIMHELLNLYKAATQKT